MQGSNTLKKPLEQDGFKKMAPKKKVKKKRYIFLKILILILICMIFFMSCALYGYRYIVDGTTQADKILTEDNAIVFKIPSGARTTTIAEQLKAQGFVKNTTVYRLMSKIMGFDNAYKAGKYLITKDMNYYALMIRLTGQPLKNPTKDIMIPEGKTLIETADILAGQGYIDEGKFLKICQRESKQYNFLKDIKATDTRKFPLEGYLYPDTYKMDEGWTEEDLITRMLNEFDRVFTQEYYDRAKELGMTVDQVVTLASLIEMEAKFPADYKKISSVFHNRLKSKTVKLLQSDATVQYARVYEGLGRTTSVLYKDLEIASPYNTYKNEGLPPGPICSPRKDAIEAALYPANTKYPVSYTH
ncbi:MAG: endolytic transglycosylase MltG, partial [Clostridia bacterium]|nr:endolytic transglycosylase MltG [Clostridia bacterium]